MSWNLTQPNQLSLYSREFNTNSLVTESLIADALDAVALNAGTVVSNTLQTTAGSNYLGVYSASKVYKLGDQVIFNNLLYRCLVNDTTGIAPDPNNPAQAQWVGLTSNNAVKNDLKYLQVSAISGNDTKALSSPVPFQTIQAALNFGGSGSYIALIDTNSIYSHFDSSAFDNVVIDGGNGGTYSIGGNVIATSTTILIGNNTTIKNVTIKDTSTINLSSLLRANNKVNITIDNVVLDAKLSDLATEIFIDNTASQTNNSDVVIVNCRALTSLSAQYIAVTVKTTTGIINTGSLRVFIINFIGPLIYSATSADVANQELQESYITNCRTIINTSLLAGSFYFNDCNFTNTLGTTSLNYSGTTTATKNKLVISNCSMFSPTSTAYARINKSGDAPYLFVNFDYDRDGINTINGTPIADISAGPATYLNQLTEFGTPGALTILQTGLTTTADKLNIPSLVADPFNILGVVTANSFVLNYTGLYQILLNVETATSTTTGQDGLIDVFIGLASSSDISSAFSRNTVARGLVNNLTNYPVNNNLATFYLAWKTVNTSPLSVYARNTNGQTFNMQIVKMSVIRLRKV